MLGYTSTATGAHDSGCSKRLSSKAVASEEARRTLQYVESLSDARTMLADFFSILLAEIPPMKYKAGREEEHCRICRSIGNNQHQIRTADFQMVDDMTLQIETLEIG